MAPARFAYRQQDSTMTMTVVRGKHGITRSNKASKSRAHPKLCQVYFLEQFCCIAVPHLAVCFFVRPSVSAMAAPPKEESSNDMFQHRKGSYHPGILVPGLFVWGIRSRARVPGPQTCQQRGQHVAVLAEACCVSLLHISACQAMRRGSLKTRWGPGILPR